MRSMLLCAAAALFGAGMAVEQAGPRPSAGTALRMDLQEIVDRSDLLIEGHVVSASPLDIGGQVHTDYQVQVDRTWWGDDLGVRTIRLPGGMLPSGRGTLIPGMPSLVAGDDVVLALTEAGPHDLRVVVGLAQGRWRIVGDGHGNKLALRGGEGMALATPDEGLPVASEYLDVMRYGDLVARLEAAAGGRRARSGDFGGK